VKSRTRTLWLATRPEFAGFPAKNELTLSRLLRINRWWRRGIERPVDWDCVPWIGNEPSGTVARGQEHWRRKKKRISRSGISGMKGDLDGPLPARAAMSCDFIDMSLWHQIRLLNWRILCFETEAAVWVGKLNRTRQRQPKGPSVLGQRFSSGVETEAKKVCTKGNHDHVKMRMPVKHRIWIEHTGSPAGGGSSYKANFCVVHPGKT